MPSASPTYKRQGAVFFGCAIPQKVPEDDDLVQPLDESAHPGSWKPLA